jgi:cysteine-S-conjugate beta-lyase
MSSFDQVIDRRETRSLKWTRYGRDVLPLWIADMDFPAPEPVRQALHAAVDHGVFGYELPTRKLGETVAARMETLYGWKISPEMVLATPGIVAALKAAARAVCSSGEGVLVQPPVYHPFLEVPEETGTVGQLAQLRQVSGRHTLRYEIDWQVFESAINSNGTRTGMFLLCQPHNPTGQIYTRAELERMAEICQHKGIVICSDEIHSELFLRGARHVPLASLSPEIARRTITLVSASKTFNVVGLLCGFAIIPDPDLRSRYREVLDHLGLHANSLGLIAAEAALSGRCDSWLNDLRAYLTGNRDYVVDFVAKEFAGIRVTAPDATYLAWLDCEELVRSGKTLPDPQRFFLRQAKVALNRGAEFGPGGEHFVRLNFGCPRSTLTEALHLMKTALVG